ncbi:TRAP transporter small permease [Pseudogracilibacillus sp. SO10305]|uniref:TRAP transporter small permease n=1 Tax=Pseudogracilibacillus sp. SO10305 TaxID=3098292 RepID=UPI00300DD644
MGAIKKVMNVLDRILLIIALTMLASMTLIILYQVFSRQLLSYTPAWSEELSRVLFVWVAFFGIAYGFKHKLHIGVGLLAEMLPEFIQTIFDILAKVTIIIFGILMIYYGINFTVLMMDSTLPGLRLPSSVLYIVIPITGMYILLYGIELLFVKGLHQDYHDEQEGDE